MSTFRVKDWVCLLDEAEMAAMRQRPAHWANKYLWRQIQIVATADVVMLSLMSVDKEAASGGYWSGGIDCRDIKFTWDDLMDTEFLESLMAHEQVVVHRCAMAMLTTLKARIVPLREALQAF